MVQRSLVSNFEAAPRLAHKVLSSPSTRAMQWPEGRSGWEANDVISPSFFARFVRTFALSSTPNPPRNTDCISLEDSHWKTLVVLRAQPPPTYDMDGLRILD